MQNIPSRNDYTSQANFTDQLKQKCSINLVPFITVIELSASVALNIKSIFVWAVLFTNVRVYT